MEKLRPIVQNILENLSINDQSDDNYVAFMQIMREKLKKKDYLKFDPFNINI